MLNSSGIQLEFKQAAPRPPLTKVTETMLAMALRESLTNIAKHSRAQHCIVTEQADDGWFHLHIEDDGIGLQEDNTEGHGLATMQERMRLLQGKVQVDRSPLGGVHVTFSIPAGPGIGEEKP